MGGVTKLVIQLRRAHTSEWEQHKDVVPYVGEPCFDIDLNTLKIGNGVDTYENLKTIGGSQFEIAADGKSMVLEDGILKLAGLEAAEVGAQPRKAADGSIEWVVPSIETIDGLKDVTDKIIALEKHAENINLQSANAGQIPYMGSDGKLAWNAIALRRDNDYNYKKIENTFIPVNGEVCLVDVAGYGLRVKIGNGINTFAELPYENNSGSQVANNAIVRGYFYQNNFYVDADHAELIAAEVGRIYIDAISGKLYTYDGVNYITHNGNMPNATSEVAGAMKLYDQIGQNTDGTMTQRSITNELNEKFEMDVIEEEEMIVFATDIN